MCAFDDFVDLSIVVFSIAISNIKKRWITIDFDELWSEEKVILAMMNKPAKPRCAGKTRAAEHSPPFRRIFEYSTSNVRLRFIIPELESLNIRQTRIQVPEVEYSICRSLHTTSNSRS